ncbi:hypothetical protein C7Y72_21935 [Paraconexibacter algicola]|uniref:Mce/MlaD domain-containing protein n=1 Tax=Paraconexibacter algicola TaxID=2133960 RepID=A0A2T4UBZ0_9ACTN|nr:hypothetical protein C7Y72_21935 [Paraconexibacter algicola]
MAPGHRRGEPRLRRQRPVHQDDRQGRRELRVLDRGRPLPAHQRPARRRQPAREDEAPADAAGRPLRDAGGTERAVDPRGPARRPPRAHLRRGLRRAPREVPGQRDHVAAPPAEDRGPREDPEGRDRAADQGRRRPSRGARHRPAGRRRPPHPGGGRVIRAIKKRRGDLFAVIGLFTIAAIVGGYILEKQRLRFPLIEESPFIVKAEFATAQAVTPGQGQTVRVSGVRIGDISKAELKDGRAIITMELDRKYDDLVREDAKALLRPKTGLKDMFIELDPGTKAAPLVKEGWTLPIASTLPDVNPDEFLQSLDTDTRDYLRLLLDGAGKGLKGRDDDLREVLRRFEPTNRDLAAVSTAVAQRRTELRRLINSLQRLTTKLGEEPDDLTELVQTSNRVFTALAAERDGVQGTVRELPGALEETRDGLAKVEQLAKVLRPAADELRPVARALRRANDRVLPFAREATPLLRTDIRPFVREARPLVRELRPAAADLVAAEPQLKRTFTVLNHLFNMLGYNPNGREPADKRGREEGYAFALAWLGHQSVNLFNNADANGPMRSITIAGTCNVLESTVASVPASEFLLGLTGVLTDPAICGGDGAAARRAKVRRDLRASERAAERATKLAQTGEAG